MFRRAAVVTALAFVVAGCAPATDAGPAEPTAAAPTTSPSTAASPTPTPSDDPAGQVVGRGTVIGEGKRVRLCHSVMQSYPPQCGGGIDLVGWTWPEEGFERASLVTWGDFAVVGTWDGRRLRVSKTVDPKTLPQPDGGDPDLSTPCPEPAGGWRAPDPKRATYDTQDRALQLAERRPGYADAWLDDRGNRTQDPTKIVLNFRFAEDLAGAEQAIREVWGGALCVSEAKRSRAELQQITRELKDDRGLVGESAWDQVVVRVDLDDGTLQRELDEKYGPDVVRVNSFLQPYAG